MCGQFHIRLGQRPPTSLFQASWFWARLASYPHVLPISLASESRSRRQLFHATLSSSSLGGGSYVIFASHCRLAMSVPYGLPMSLTDVFFNGLVLCSYPKVFLCDLVYPVDLKHLPEAGSDEDFPQAVDGGSQGLCSIE
ncbi:hypothetical protein DPMN_067575 [Dreissena polymorpha]|uniref:Uncharacterized protein n=1 Tax=Dreissena polymorpha TaxID=45954 RepID=A0A9D4BLG2_DREPO|nr:hypothetical protein DPMN_067575 [Dreissena polymorpha]